MPRFLKILVAFIAGLVVGWAIPIGWYIIATNYLGLVDRDGGGAMGAFFIIGPMSALIAGTTAALVTARRTG